MASLQNIIIAFLLGMVIMAIVVFSIQRSRRY